MAIVEKLSKDEIKQATGGTIVEIKGSKDTYYVLVNEKRKGQYVSAQHTLEAAKYVCDKYGISQEVISEEEYENRYHQKVLY